MFNPDIETRSIEIAGLKLPLVKCPCGSFLMGSQFGFPAEQPARRMAVEQPFCISATLVTQDLWTAVMQANPSKFQFSAKHPVDSVSYDDCLDFCTSASTLSGHSVSLPTELQWEYACRAGTETEFFWGESEADALKYAWYELNSADATHEVAQLLPNPWGIYDIVGNLWEWCADSWCDHYPTGLFEKNSPAEFNAEISRKCLRGGAWDMDLFRLRAAYRSFDHRGLGTPRFGLRVVVDLD